MFTPRLPLFLLLAPLILIGGTSVQAQIDFKGERPANPSVYRGGPQPGQQSIRSAVRQKLENAIEKGNAARDAEKYTDAEAEYKRALSINPKEERAHLGLGNVSSDLGHYDEAVQSYREAIRLKPTDAEAYVRLAQAYADLEKNDEAQEAANRALQLNPKLATAHFCLGRIYFSDNRFPEAIEQFQITTRLKPDDVMAHFALGFACVRVGNKSGAITEQQELDRLRRTATTDRDQMLATFGAGTLRDKIKEMP